MFYHGAATSAGGTNHIDKFFKKPYMYEYGLFTLRVLAGIGIATHGIPKLMDLKGTMGWMKSIGLPSIAGVFAALLEGVGAFFLILGIATQIVATLLLLNMAGALFYHIKSKHSFKGMEDAYLYACIFITLSIAGGGAFSAFPLKLW